jgi:hypothetical protein
MVEPITDRPQQGEAADVHRCLRRLYGEEGRCERR